MKKGASKVVSPMLLSSVIDCLSLHGFGYEALVLACRFNPFWNDSIEEILLLRMQGLHVKTYIFSCFLSR